MKLALKLKLIATSGSHASLLETLERANACANWISEQAWAKKTFGQYALHHLCYYEAKERFSLGSGIVVRAIGKVAEAYLTHKHKRIKFKKHGAFPYDRHILRYYEDQHVSIWTVHGRRKLAYECGPRAKVLMEHRQGQTELVPHNGQFYLIAIANIDDPPIQDVSAYLGVDFGIKIIAAASDGQAFSGSHVTSVRCRRSRFRRKLQRCGSKSAKRHLKKLSGKESRFATNVNHVISKQIVAEAKRTNCGIAIEDLNGIRQRIRARRKQRALLHSWAFSQLRSFLTYKAALAGIPLITVDPRNSSRECSACGHIEKANRLTQSKFVCRSCGHAENADINAARVIAGRADTKQPIAARSV